MTYTEYFPGETGKTYYAKPIPLSSTPTWGTDAIAGTVEVANEIAFVLDANKSYWVYERAGASPAITDSRLAKITQYVYDDFQAIYEKAMLIGQPGSVLAAGAVASDGTIAEIIIGDDYLAANGRAFEWTVSAPTGLTRTECTCWFGGEALGDGEGSWRVEGTLTDAGSGNWKMSFDLPRTATESCTPSLAAWSAAIHGPTGIEITKVRKGKKNQTQLVRKQT